MLPDIERWNNPLKAIRKIAAGRRQRKKAVVQQTIAMPQIRPYGGFEQIKAAVFLCHINYEKYRKLNLTVRRKTHFMSLKILFWELLEFFANNEQNPIFQDIRV